MRLVGGNNQSKGARVRFLRNPNSPTIDVLGFNVSEHALRGNLQCLFFKFSWQKVSPHSKVLSATVLDILFQSFFCLKNYKLECNAYNRFAYESIENNKNN